MSDLEREFLVVIDSVRSTEVLARLRVAVHVTQVFSPRLALVRNEPGAMERARAIPGVQHVRADDPRDLIPDLTPSEHLFVSAWVERVRPKTRRGEGLNWDAPGFEPPDRPREK
ncbi:MAG: hypothetical protein FJX48_12955 [Alphaproteobacteria bacterium]|nr:hypothetical protein [Alphaproteobacteria bacterium]